MKHNSFHGNKHEDQASRVQIAKDGGARTRDKEGAEPLRNDQELGRGRSGIVYKSHDQSGREIARKVFATSGLSKVVQYALLGGPNPYIWCEQAIRAAVLRRKILAEFVEVWFGSKLSVARAYTHAWNSNQHAFQMSCELIRGRHVALRQPFSPTETNELRDLTKNVMKPLQRHLADAGFDGLVWQAGRGNPVALNNFMRTETTEKANARWVWIDLESGVPALFPANPLELLRFYLPKSIQHRGPLFDDIDIAKLRDYLTKQESDLERKIGVKRFAQLESNVNELATCQSEWKSLTRLQGSLLHRRVTGSISHKQAEWYEKHPLRWYARESIRGLARLGMKLVQGAASLIESARNLELREAARKCTKFIASQKYRVQLARNYVTSRISDWRSRRQLTADDAITLGSHLSTEEATAYITDFGVQLAVKPLVKAVEWWIIPTLWITGVIGSATLGFLLIALGPIVRTIYTLGRIAQNTAARRERPWVALLVGTIPCLGTLAYPVQILASGAKEESDLARFILHDAFARIGQWIPIWGGRDTHTEHMMNRCPDAMLKLLRFRCVLPPHNLALKEPRHRNTSMHPVSQEPAPVAQAPAYHSPEQSYSHFEKQTELLQRKENARN